MDLAAQVRKGDHRSLARAISLVENDSDAAQDLLQTLYPATGHAYLVGVTGPPGTGKSTLVDRLISAYRKLGRSVGVLAVDPSSPFTGGALLGDRVRMVEHSLDSEVFIRSMATRGTVGGLARAARNALRILDASGKDIVLLETVGIGQADVEVMRAVDAIVVVVMPELGDEIQTTKAGLMEIGDIFVVNKADLAGADRAVLHLKQGLTLRRGWHPPVVETVAKTGQGIDHLIDAIQRFYAHVERSGQLQQSRNERVREELLDLVHERVVKRIDTRIVSDNEFAALVKRVQGRQLDPQSAADQLLRKMGWTA